MNRPQWDNASFLLGALITAVCGGFFFVVVLFTYPPAATTQTIYDNNLLAPSDYDLIQDTRIAANAAQATPATATLIPTNTPRPTLTTVPRITLTPTHDATLAALPSPTVDRFSLRVSYAVVSLPMRATTLIDAGNVVQVFTKGTALQCERRVLEGNEIAWRWCQWGDFEGFMNDAYLIPDTGANGPTPIVPTDGHAFPPNE